MLQYEIRCGVPGLRRSMPDHQAVNLLLQSRLQLISVSATALFLPHGPRDRGRVCIVASQFSTSAFAVVLVQDFKAVVSRCQR